ncbi:MAG: hypothetical protein OYG31_03130 [Candidatus Kaiserbacteria bacterium]|nr:hypothetical protein [Candidatus Kaiserbacteria bacterium]
MIALRFAVPLLFGLLFFIPTALFAQQVGSPTAYLLEIDEGVPSPGKEVTVHIRGEDERVTSIRSIRWFVDGQERTAYTDKMSLKEVVGNQQKRIVARIVYSVQGGIRRYINATTAINPVTFDLLWEGHSVTTPRYRGYPLAGPQVPIHVYAEIQYIDRNGITYDENDFSFVWEVETSFHEDTGPGVSSIVYEKGGSLINNDVYILARATLINDHTVRFRKAVSIPITESRIIVYPYTVTRGLITERAIPSDVAIRKQPLTTSLYPFFFSREDFENPNAISYTWNIRDGLSPLQQGRKVDISLRGEDTIIPVQVSAQNREKTQQKAQNTLNVSL